MKRGPKSSAELAIVAPIIAERPRLPVPASLTDAERECWRATVASLPSSWFSAEHSPLLERYCRHVVRSRCLEAMLQETDAASDLDRYAKLARLCGEESGRILAVARSLRLTLQSRHPVTAGRQAAGARPQPDVRVLFEEHDDD